VVETGFWSLASWRNRRLGIHIADQGFIELSPISPPASSDLLASSRSPQRRFDVGIAVGERRQKTR
jgi:hypothetical protein